jgi:hypothetical protein
VTADHWPFVLAAYGVAAVVLGGYWRHLRRRERALAALADRRAAAERRPRTGATAGRAEPAEDRA